MASGKTRGTKRSSATSSYSSATSIVIFVGLSVLGLWLLTSNSFAPSQPPATKSPATRITSIGHTHHSNVLPQTRQNENDSSPISDDAVLIQPETNIENDETQTDNAFKTEAILTDHVDHQDTKGSQHNNDAVEEQDKQAALETQTSEESSMTQKEEMIQETPHFETKMETNDAEDISAEGGSLSQNSDTTQNQISDEDQQRRIDEHQQQEDEQKLQGGQEAHSADPNGAISHDQIQHDEAPIYSHQDGSSSQETGKPNAQATNQETKIDSLDGEATDKVTLSQKMNEETSNKNDEASTSSEDSTEIPKESTESKNSWTTQANQSENQKERRNAGSSDKENSSHGYTWLLCNVTAGADYIPCLDNEKVIANIHNRLHHEHRERHCPEDPPTCLVPHCSSFKVLLMADMVQQCTSHITGRIQGTPELGEGDWGIPLFPRWWNSIYSWSPVTKS